MTDNSDVTPLSSQAQEQLNRKRSRLDSSHRSPHGHSGSGAGLWLAGSRSPSLGPDPKQLEDRAEGSDPVRDSLKMKIEDEDNVEQSKRRTYHFPAELARGSTLGLSLASETDSPIRANTFPDSDSQDVDLDLSFDYISNIESDSRRRAMKSEQRTRNPHVLVTSIKSHPTDDQDTNATSPSKPYRGMASADWDKRRKQPPAPLRLKQASISSNDPLRPRNNNLVPVHIQSHMDFQPLPDELVGESVFSPITPTPGLGPKMTWSEEEPLPLTPLSATRRGAMSFRPDNSSNNLPKPDSPDHYQANKENFVTDAAQARVPSTRRPKRGNVFASSSISSLSKVVTGKHRMQSSIGSSKSFSSANISGPPPFPPPTVPLPAPGSSNSSPTSSAAALTEYDGGIQGKFPPSQSRSNVTVRSSSIGSFQTAEAGASEKESSHGHGASSTHTNNETQGSQLVGTALVYSRQTLGGQSFGPSSTPMLLSASATTAVTASGSDRSSTRSHVSPLTPFSPLFSDPGTAKTNLTSSSEMGAGEWTPAHVVGFGASALELTKLDAQEADAANEKRERRKTERWILAQRERKTNIQRTEIDTSSSGHGDIEENNKRVYSIRAEPARTSLVEADEYGSCEGSSSEGQPGNETLVISTSSSLHDNAFTQGARQASAQLPGKSGPPANAPSMARHQSAMEMGSTRVAPPMQRNRSGTTGPWPQSPLLLTSNDTVAMPSYKDLGLPSPTGTTIIKDLPEDNPLHDKMDTEQALFDPSDHRSTKAPSRDADFQASSSQSASIGLGLGLGLDLGPIDMSHSSNERIQSLKHGTISSPSEICPVSPTLAYHAQDTVGSPYLAIDMDADKPVSAQEVPLVRSSLAYGGPSSYGSQPHSGALGLDLGLHFNPINGASPAMLDDCRSPRTFSGKQMGSNGGGGIENTIAKTVGTLGPHEELMVNQSAVERIYPRVAPSQGIIHESHSIGSSISAFAFNETPPIRSEDKFHSRPAPGTRKSAISNLWRLSKVNNSSTAEFIDLDLDDPRQAAVADAVLAQDASRSRWRSKLWNVVASPGHDKADRFERTAEEQQKRRSGFKPLTLVNKRQSLPAVGKVAGDLADKTGAEKAKEDSRAVVENLISSASGSASSVGTARWMAEQAPNSATREASPSVLASVAHVGRVADVETKGERVLLGSLPSPTMGAPFSMNNSAGGLQRQNSTASTSSAAKHAGPTDRQAKRNSGIGYISDKGKSKRNSGIGYITDKMEFDFGQSTLTNNVDAPRSHQRRASMQRHSRQLSLTTFGGKERAPTQSKIEDPMDAIKSPRVAPSPSGFTPRMQFKPSDWGAMASETESQPNESQWTNGLTFDQLQESRDRLRLLASQTMPGATLPHQYLENDALKRRSNVSTRPAHHRPTASMQSFEGLPEVAEARQKLESSGLHRRTRTARFANEPYREDWDEEGEPVVTCRRPVSVMVPSTSIEAHLMRRAGVDVGTNHRRSRRMMPLTPSRTFGTPSNVLESATPSKSMFWAGFLGMPWLWLIGGWWLGEDGLVITPSVPEKVEFWQHEPSMSNQVTPQSSPEMAQEGFDSSVPGPSAPQDGNMTQSGTTRTLKSQQTFRSLHSQFTNGPAPSVTSSAATSSTTKSTHSNANKVPQSKRKSLASLMDPRPEVVLYQSPVRVVEGMSANNLMRMGPHGAFKTDMERVPEDDGEESPQYKGPDDVDEKVKAESKEEAYLDEAFQHPFTRSMRRNRTADGMILAMETGPMRMFKSWGRLERYVLLNRVAAIFGSMLVIAGWSTAVWAVVANF